MLFGTSNRLTATNANLTIRYRNTTVNFTEKYKYLGIILSPTLSMSTHFNATYKKVAARIRMLKRIRFFINSDTASKIYRSMIVPVLTYSPLVTMNVNNTEKEKILSLENRARKIISPHNDVVIPKVLEIVRKRCCVYAYKCLHGEVCDNFVNYFDFTKTRVQTRNTGILIRLPKIKTEQAKKGFFFTGAKLFNQLPVHVRQAETVQEFKRVV